MLFLAICPLNTDHSESLTLTRTRIAREMKISAGTFRKYFIDTDNPNKPKPINLGGRLVFREEEVNNFLINHVIPVHTHMVLMEAQPTRVPKDPQSNYYTLINKHNVKTFKPQTYRP